MKKELLKLVGLFIIVINTSCEKFLEVSSQQEVLEETIFKDGANMRIAVNGVYRGISEPSLYGKNLTWGMLSAMGYNYEINSDLGTAERQVADFNWENISAQELTEQVWKKTYNVIANCNNIIQQAESKDSTFFEHGEMEKRLIIGEMTGLRGMLHFEMLRLFAPSFKANHNGSALPYVTAYPTKQPEHIGMELFFKKITTDMEKARELLASIDTIKYDYSLWRLLQGRIKQINNTKVPEGLFFTMRAQRMNYHAATVLLARMHLYKGDHKEALRYADTFYQFNKKKNRISWTPAIYQGSINLVDLVHIKKIDELILAGHNVRNFDNWEAVTIPPSAYQMKNMDILFQNDRDDYRYVGYYNRYSDKRYLTWARPRSNDATTVIAQGPIIPMIRLSEAFHIMIECLLEEGKKAEAFALFKTIRTNRGTKRILNENMTVEEMKEELYQDIIKETLTEGHTFYLFKRLQRDIYNGLSNRIMKPEEWTIPIPYSESSY